MTPLHFRKKEPHPNNVSFLDAMGARRIPDPTTARDYLMRFGEKDVVDLMEGINQARIRVWKAQRSDFRRRAVIDVDGTIVETSGEKKEGTDFAYNGKFGYGPLVVTLANTGEVLEPATQLLEAHLEPAIQLMKQPGLLESTLSLSRAHHSLHE